MGLPQHGGSRYSHGQLSGLGIGDPHILAKVSRGLGEPMTGIGMDQITTKLADRGW